jgi:hypothetical protein
MADSGIIEHARGLPADDVFHQPRAWRDVFGAMGRGRHCSSASLGLAGARLSIFVKKLRPGLGFRMALAI